MNKRCLLIVLFSVAIIVSLSVFAVLSNILYLNRGYWALGGEIFIPIILMGVFSYNILGRTRSRNHEN